MRVSLIGAGCVGSVIAQRILKEGFKDSFRIIANDSFADRLISEGIQVNGEALDFLIQKESDPKPDLVFVCVKNYDLEKACEDIAPYISQETAILPLLNSISPTPFIKSRFPQNTVLYGYITRIDAYKSETGFHYNIPGDIHFGEATNICISPLSQRIKEFIDLIGFRAVIDEDMVRGIWKKWMLNVGANQVSALTGANYLQFAQIPEIEQILRLSMQELLTIACYEGVDLGTKDIAEIITYLMTYPYPKKTSMLQDVELKRRTEIDYISGDILKLSQKWSCPCPVNLAMYYLIKSKEKMYLAEQDC